MNSILKINKWLFPLLILGNIVIGQNQNEENLTTLKIKLQNEKVDTTKVKILNEIADNYKYPNASQGILYGNKALTLAEKIHWNKETAKTHSILGTCNHTLSNYSQAINHFQKAIECYQKTSNEQGIAATYKEIALTYSSQKKYTEALSYFEKTLKKYQSIGNKTQIVFSLNDIANLYFIQNNYAKAKEYYNQSTLINKNLKDNNGFAYCLTRLGEISLKEKQYNKATYYFSKAIESYDKSQVVNSNNALKQLSNTYILLSKSDPINSEKYASLSVKTLKKIAKEEKKEYSESVESLKESLKTVPSDTAKITILNKISSKYFYTNPKEGLKHSEEALRLSKKINWKKGIAVSNDYSGVCQWVLSDYSKAISNFFNSLKYYEELKDENGISGIYNNLGLIFGEIKNYPQAFHYFNLAYKINTKTGNKISMVYNLNNIASTYIIQGNLTKALHYFKLSENLNESLNDFNGLGYVYTNIGKINSKLGHFEEALKIYNKALISYDDSQVFNRGAVYIEMGNTYLEMAKSLPNNKKQLLKLSEQALLKANNIFFSIGTLDKINECNLKLYENLKEQKNFEKSLFYYEKFIVLKDSILYNENQNKLFNLKNKREIELKDKQIEIQNLKINSESRKVYLLVTITATIALLLILFFWLYINKRSTNQLLLDKNKEISKINKQKDKFFSIIAHDLRGPFNGFLGLTELLAEDIDDMEKDEIQFAAVNMRSSANNLNLLLENLLEWSRMEQGLIPFNPQENILSPVVNECRATLEIATNKKEIEIQTIISEETNIYADNNILHAVIRNILSNAVKFTPKGGTIIIQGTEDDKNTTISIKDSGIGMNAKILENLFQLDVKTNRKGTDDEPSSGLGLILCKEFVEKHGGKIWVESEENKGSTFYFSFPKNNITNTV
jgi:signal transduction histidine kinase/uncharacterized protein HemY